MIIIQDIPIWSLNVSTPLRRYTVYTDGSEGWAFQEPSGMLRETNPPHNAMLVRKNDQGDWGPLGKPADPDISAALEAAYQELQS